MKTFSRFIFIPLAFFILIQSNGNAQILDWCGTPSYFAEAQFENKEYVKFLKDHEKRLKKNTKKKYLLSNDTIYIPVIVHVVYNKDTQNISDAQIISQINVLNEDYLKMAGTRGYNTSPIGANTKLEFRLAQRDTNNNPTTGIERIKTTVVEFTDRGVNKDAVKFAKTGGANAWNSSKYLNMWVCNLRTDLLGYATFPGGDSLVDGVVISYQYFGDSVGTSMLLPYALGRTTTHEIGHWLNLYHTFQDGCPNSNCLDEGDRVCDTPPVDTPTYGCPLNRISCKNPILSNDYMDYTNDICMNIYTEGQNYRIRSTIDYIRSKLKTSPALVDKYFYLFGIHNGKFNYILNSTFLIKGTGLYAPFIVANGSSVEIKATGGSKVSIEKNMKIYNGSSFLIKTLP